MSERLKFGETRLIQFGTTADPLNPETQVPLFRGEMGEGRIPFVKWTRGVSVIQSNSEAMLRVELNKHKILVRASEPPFTQGFSRHTPYYFTASLDDGDLSLAIYNTIKGDEPSLMQKHPDIHPDVLLDEAFKYFHSQRLRIRTIQAAWNASSSNYLEFKRLAQQGFSKKEAALATWTGNQATKRGFVIRDEKDIHDFGGGFVSVTFSRPKPHIPLLRLLDKLLPMHK